LLFEKLKIRVSSADFACFRNIGRVGMSARLKLYQPRELNGANGHVTLFEMPVDGWNGNAQIVGFQNMVEMLTAANALGNDAIVFIKGFLVERYSLACGAQVGFVCLVRVPCAVNMLVKSTDAMAMLTGIADERSLKQELTRLVQMGTLYRGTVNGC
jgi:hypothetical protein